MENLVLEPQLQADLDAVLNRGVKSAYVREDGHLIFVMSDNQEVDLGDIQGPVMEAVKTYIEEHAVTVDDTLTVSGAAADAAAVGVRFGDMESRLERFQEKFDETDEKLENVESAAQAAADMAADAAERQEALEQALLQKIEDLGSSRVAKSGDTMTGSLDLGGNDLQNVGTAQLQVLALLPPNDPDGELGVNAYAEAAILGEDGHPTGQVLSFYGIFNDEPAVLRNVHDPVMDTDAVPKGYLEQYMNTHGGAAEVHVGGDEPDADSVQLWLDTDEEASSGSVTSVNGKTGAVELTAEDVGALPNTTVIPVVPDALPNPSKLILTGAVEAEYDGSQEVTVEIPAGGSGGSGGGTDLGITGATVGQIAKITAVDDEGKPTAWEPVALAEAWEHICDISVSGEDEIKAFTQEFDVPYKKLRIVRLATATAPTTGTIAGGQYWSVACDKDANNNNQTVVWMFDNDTWVTHIVECELLSPNVTWGKAYTSVYSKGFRGEYKTYGLIPEKGFSSIKIGAHKLFNDGTFRIYGVRA